MSNPIYGQSDAVAVEIAAALNANSGNFCLAVAAERRFARKLDVGDISSIGSAVTVQVFPGDELADLQGLDGIYDDTYGCHILILQNVANATTGGLDEAQMQLLLALRSQIVEFVASKLLSAPDAVHPFSRAQVKACRNDAKEGIYDLNRLEQTNVFYSDLIVTYKMPGLRRRN